MNRLRTLIMSAVLVAVTGTSFAREIAVAGPEAFHAAIAQAQPGDTVTLKDGVWRDADLAIFRGGSPGKRLLVRAQTPGKVVLTGNSSLKIVAPYVSVEGLLFSKGSIAHGSVIAIDADDAVLTDCAVVDYNPPAFNTGYYWLYFKGSGNVVNRCYFAGKSNMEPVVGNDLENARHNTVSHCWFKDIPYNAANGREIFRIWGPGKYEAQDGDGAYFTIAYNLFDHADGEGSEVVSLKSNHNLVAHNTLIATRGGLNIRRANYNTIRDNIILGEGVDRARGIRVSGEHNTITGNYISRCKRGIEISAGEYIASPLTPGYQPDRQSKGTAKPDTIVPTYPRVKDLVLTENTIVACAQADLAICPDYKKYWPRMQMVLLPENCRIENNRIVRPDGGVSITGPTIDTKPPLDRFSFRPNRYAHNVLVGGEDAYAPSAAGFERQPVPAHWTEQSERASLHPLTPAEVGPNWMHGSAP